MNIETEQLRLIPVSEEHTNDIFEHFNEQIITYMAPSVSQSLAEMQKIVQGFIEQRKQSTDFVYAIIMV